MKPRLSFAVDEDEDEEVVPQIQKASAVQYTAVKRKPTAVMEKVDISQYLADSDDDPVVVPSYSEEPQPMDIDKSSTEEPISLPQTPPQQAQSSTAVNFDGEDYDLAVDDEEAREWEAAQLRKAMAASGAPGSGMSTDHRRLAARLQSQVRLEEVPEIEDLVAGLQATRKRLQDERDALMAELAAIEAVDTSELEASIRDLKTEIEVLEKQQR